jgi:hypothetical protein
MKDLLWYVLSFYVPPDPADINAVKRFQWGQSINLVALWFTLWVSGLWLVGKFPFLPQVAWAAQVGEVTEKISGLASENSKISGKLNDIQLLQLRANLENELKYLCQAQRARNQTDLDNANRQMDDMTDAYFRLAGRPFPSPSCDTVLTTNK